MCLFNYFILLKIVYLFERDQGGGCRLPGARGMGGRAGSQDAENVDLS